MEQKKYSKELLIGIFIFGIALTIFLGSFVVADFYNKVTTTYVQNGTNITVLVFNISNTTAANGTESPTLLHNITINNTGTSAVGNNITRVTITNGTWIFSNASLNGIPYIIAIDKNITHEMNLTINFTINSSMQTDGATIQANITALENSSGALNYTALPFNSSTTTIDGAGPTVSASCNDVNKGDALDCSCSASDNVGGVNSTSTKTDSDSGTGTQEHTTSLGFTFTCKATDWFGRTNSTTAKYIVSETSSNRDRGTSGTTGTTWSTHAITQEQFQNGYTSQIQVNKRIRVQVEGEDHHVGVKEVSSETVKLEISSELQEANLAIGDSRRFDVTGDGYYDILVTLNDIVDGKADLTIKSIHEEITEETEQEEAEKETTSTGEGEEEPISEEEDLTWLWIVIGVVVLAAVIGGGVAAKKRKRQ